MGRVQWKVLPDGTPVRIDLRTLSDGRTVMFPFPLWVEINDENRNRWVRLAGHINDAGEPVIQSIAIHAQPTEQGWEDASLGEGLSDADLARWIEKAVGRAVLAVDGEAEPPSIHRSARLNELDRQAADEMLRELRRRRGRPGRPPVPWEWKVKAKQLKDRGMSGRQIEERGEFPNDSTGRSYRRAQIDRWVREVKAAEQEETSDE